MGGAHADKPIFLDLPTRSCVAGALRRWLRWHGRVRSDLPDGCRETIDLAFLRWVLRYRRTRRGAVLERLASLDATA